MTPNVGLLRLNCSECLYQLLPIEDKFVGTNPSCDVCGNKEFTLETITLVEVKKEETPA